MQVLEKSKSKSNSIVEELPSKMPERTSTKSSAKKPTSSKSDMNTHVSRIEDAMSEDDCLDVIIDLMSSKGLESLLHFEKLYKEVFLNRSFLFN